MDKKIIWTPRSEKTFNSVIKYLLEEWTEKEVENFVTATGKVIEIISKYPEIFRSSGKANIHESVVTKHNLLIYKINGDSIDLILFWNTRQNPKKKLRRK